MPTLFEERLTPGIFTSLIAVVFGAMLGVILMPVSETVGLTAAIVLAVGFPSALWFSSPRVALTTTTLSAGRAHINVRYLGEVTPLDRAGMHRILGPDIYPANFHLVRGWVPTGVHIEILDKEDPTPAWVFSLRDCEGFVSALATVKKADAAHHHSGEATSD